MNKFKMIFFYSQIQIFIKLLLSNILECFELSNNNGSNLINKIWYLSIIIFKRLVLLIPYFLERLKCSSIKDFTLLRANGRNVQEPILTQ